MIVTILKKHGNRYDRPCGCPIFNAIRENHPEIPISSVGGTYITLEDFTYRKMLTLDFYSTTVDDLQTGKLKSFDVEIDMDTVIENYELL